MRDYDEKRYRIAPWKGRFGDQEHAKRVNPNIPKIKDEIVRKKREIERLHQQIHQLEVLRDKSSGVFVDGVLVREICGPPGESEHYQICLVSEYEHRAAKIYPNAHNDGRTYGYHIHMNGYPFHRDEWRGAGHTYEQAVEGARVWVLYGKKLPARYDRKVGTVREEP